MANRLSFNVTANVMLVAPEMKDVGKPYIVTQIGPTLDNN